VNLNGDNTFTVSDTMDNETYTIAGQASLTAPASALLVPAGPWSGSFSMALVPGCGETPKLDDLWWAPIYSTSDSDGVYPVIPTVIFGRVASSLLYDGSVGLSGPNTETFTAGGSVDGQPFVYGCGDTPTDTTAVAETAIYPGTMYDAPLTRVTIQSTWSGTNGSGIPQKYVDEYSVVDHPYSYAPPFWDTPWNGHPRVAMLSPTDGYGTCTLIFHFDSSGSDGKVVDVVMGYDYAIDGGPDGEVTAFTDLADFSVEVSGTTLTIGGVAHTISRPDDPEWAGMSDIRIDGIFSSVIWNGTAFVPWVTMGEVQGFAV
jgi:hypothetical protein